MKNLLICIPTYNEISNIEKLILSILDQYSQACVLVVDDNSPDGTGSVVEELRKHYERRLFCIHRERKMGLGSAYIEAFSYGAEHGYGSLITMDADFSHNPLYIQELEKLLKKYDFVIGSRYIEGGSVSNWGFVRRLMSKIGNLYANFLLRTPHKDLTGGFNAYRVPVLEDINFRNIISLGYCFQIEVKYRCYKQGYKGVELPIEFCERRGGQSKIGPYSILEAFINVPKIRSYSKSK